MGVMSAAVCAAKYADRTARLGFSFDELEKAGLARMGRKGPMDRFHRRLLWPIRNISGDVIGFGARKLFDDDNLGKYMNTPETMLYKKSKVLFGLDHAKKSIAEGHRAVIVEGYTDVMAMHAAGVTTAVAACGTAFGEEHLQMLRRLMLDDSFFRGELIYTFDGDEAGQKAAMRAFEGEQQFTGQSYVAVAPDGMDPCDLRLEKGDASVRDLVAQRTPLVEFVLRTLLSDYDMTTPNGRVEGLRRVVPVLGKIRDTALRDEYAREVAGWVGWNDEAEFVRRVRDEARNPSQDDGPRRRPIRKRDEERGRAGVARFRRWRQWCEWRRWFRWPCAGWGARAADAAVPRGPRPGAARPARGDEARDSGARHHRARVRRVVAGYVFASDVSGAFRRHPGSGRGGVAKRRRRVGDRAAGEDRRCRGPRPGHRAGSGGDPRRSGDAARLLVVGARAFAGGVDRRAGGAGEGGAVADAAVR